MGTKWLDDIALDNVWMLEYLQTMLGDQINRFKVPDVSGVEKHKTNYCLSFVDFVRVACEHDSFHYHMECITSCNFSLAEEYPISVITFRGKGNNFLWRELTKEVAAR